jgi:hypothetical protein
LGSRWPPCEEPCKLIPFVSGKTDVEAAKTANPSAEQREQQRRSFAFGNAALENDLITREMVDREAERLARESDEPDKR